MGVSSFVLRTPTGFCTGAGGGAVDAGVELTAQNFWTVGPFVAGGAASCWSVAWRRCIRLVFIDGEAATVELSSESSPEKRMLKNSVPGLERIEEVGDEVGLEGAP